ncbi:MAG: hypothetical protein C3F12_08410 [Candidatus Methylomirabilota bacterium]|nr:MAG: hypothetical protein C3F12_08410 [candidate division NC10 bacterium]
MARRVRWLVSFALGVALSLHAVVQALSGDIQVVGRFGPSTSPEGFPNGWKPLTFRKIPSQTRYTMIREGEHYVVKAESHASASGLYKALDLDPKVYRVISWRWKVENILAKGDARRKEGDDYPARLYVAFQYDARNATLWEKTSYGAYKLIYGEYPPKNVINYIWDSRLPKGTAIDSAYTDRAKMIAVESGAEHVGRWVREERNLYDDYTRLFGKAPPRIAGIALMTDTDNTGEDAVAYYGDIVLQSVDSGDR